MSKRGSGADASPGPEDDPHTHGGLAAWLVHRRASQPVSPGLAAVVRGGWTGFVVLFLGDILTLWRGRGSGLVLYWLAALAYAVAGNRAAAASGGRVAVAMRDGAGAAVFAYALTIPLRQSAGSGVTFLGTIVALLAAAMVGALAGAIVARARGRQARAALTAETTEAIGPAYPRPPAGGRRPRRAHSRAISARRIISLPDGRQMECTTDGPVDGLALVFHHGTPGSSEVWREAADTASGLGLRLVMCSRPGYSRSTRHEGRVVADVATDLSYVLDELGIGEFVTAGWSGGGPHALACAALLGERCLAAGVMAATAPFDDPGIDWFAGMGPESVLEYSLAESDPSALLDALSPIAASMVTMESGDLAAALGSLSSGADSRALTGPFSEYLTATFRRAVVQGVAGWHDDDLALVRPWGFDVASIAVPTSIWQAGQDLMVPAGHGARLAARIPGARHVVLEDEGHISIGEAAFPALAESLAAVRP